MEQSQRSFEEQLKYGKDFEDRMAWWLIQKGWFVTPKYLFCEEGAPLLIGRDNKYAIPDLDIAKDGKRLWIECKRKKRMFKHPATGYPESNQYCYKKVQEITGDRVFIIFEDDTNDPIIWYGNYIDELEKYIYKRNWDFEGKEHITFKYPDAFIPIDF